MTTTTRMGTIAIILCLVLVRYAEGRCSTLPSGRCYVTCQQEVYNVICSNITADVLREDLKIFTGLTQMLRLYIWDSPGIKRLPLDVFHAVETQILVLDLQDVSNLDTFPELYRLANLYRVTIWNAQNVTELSLDLLPRDSIRYISLNKIGARIFHNDFREIAFLPKLETFVLRNVTIEYWQPSLLKAFPALKTLRINNCTWAMDVPNEPLAESSWLGWIQLRRLNFTKKSAEDFFHSFLGSLRLAERGNVDLANHKLPFTNQTWKVLGQFTNASALSVAGNKHDNSSVIPVAFFENFTKLEVLDLGRNDFPPVLHLYRNLPNLVRLHMDSNEFDYAGETSMFGGFKGSNFQVLDLTSCGVPALPTRASFNAVVQRVRYFNLTGNRLTFLEQPPQSYPALPVLKEVEELRIGSNGLRKVHSAHFTDMSKLKRLDLNGNRFREITALTFQYLPQNLEYLDISLGIRPPEEPPRVDTDAFSVLPPIKVLRMSTSSYKQWIFSRMKFTNATRDSLEEIHLDDNVITFMSRGMLPTLPNLRVLSVKNNMLQSLQPMTFAGLPSLKELYLDGNTILMIERNTFTGPGARQLRWLEVLGLSNNRLRKLKRGALDELPKLRSLMIGWNPIEVHDIFIDGGQELNYIGVQNYTKSCLKPRFFNQLRKLKYVFFDDYNFLRVNPDRSMFSRDDYLLSVKKDCLTGEVTPDHETYPGLRNYVGVTVRDIGERKSTTDYPTISAFLPLNYCPQDDYTTALNNILC